MVVEPINIVNDLRLFPPWMDTHIAAGRKRRATTPFAPFRGFRVPNPSLPDLRVLRELGGLRKR